MSLIDRYSVSQLSVMLLRRQQRNTANQLLSAYVWRVPHFGNGRQPGKATPDMPISEVTSLTYAFQIEAREFRLKYGVAKPSCNSPPPSLQTPHSSLRRSRAPRIRLPLLTRSACRRLRPGVILLRSLRGCRLRILRRALVCLAYCRITCVGGGERLLLGFGHIQI